MTNCNGMIHDSCILHDVVCTSSKYLACSLVCSSSSSSISVPHTADVALATLLLAYFYFPVVNCKYDTNTSNTKIQYFYNL